MSNDTAYTEPSGLVSTPDYYQGPNSDYNAPPLEEDAPYIDAFGWAPSLRLGPETLPDASRLQQIPLRDFQRGTSGNVEAFYDDRDANTRSRSSVEQTDANGWEDVKGIHVGDQRFTPNPNLIPVAESRLIRHPRSYAFLRPFGNGGAGNPKVGAKALTGDHFSMADHRRNYETHGMEPVRSSRNTYRIEPEPWDIDIIDVPPNADPSPNGRIQSVEVPRDNRNWRL